MKVSDNATLQRVGALLTIVGMIGGGVWKVESFLSDKFSAQDTKITGMARDHGKETAELKAEIAKNKAESDAKIAALQAALQAEALNLPRQQRELIHDLMPTKAARLPVKGISSDELRMKSAAHD